MTAKKRNITETTTFCREGIGKFSSDQRCSWSCLKLDMSVKGVPLKVHKRAIRAGNRNP